MEQHRYRIEQPHDYCYEELCSQRHYYEHSGYYEQLRKSFIDKGFSFVEEVRVSVSCYWNEIMIATNKQLSENELNCLVAYWGKDAHCTDYW